MDNLKAEAAAWLHKHRQRGLKGSKETSKIYEIKLIFYFGNTGNMQM